MRNGSYPSGYSRAGFQPVSKAAGLGTNPLLNHFHPPNSGNSRSFGDRLEAWSYSDEEAARLSFPSVSIRVHPWLNDLL